MEEELGIKNKRLIGLGTLATFTIGSVIGSFSAIVPSNNNKSAELTSTNTTKVSSQPQARSMERGLFDPY